MHINETALHYATLKLNTKETLFFNYLKSLSYRVF